MGDREHHRHEQRSTEEPWRGQSRGGRGGRGSRQRQRWEGPGGPFPGGHFGGPNVFGRRMRGRGPGGGPRRRRGDVRAALLALLAERPMHGYEMIQELEERTSGMWRPSPGAVYPALQLLDDQGLVQAVEVDGKKRYELTDTGRAEVPEQPPWEDVTRGVDPAQLQLHDLIPQIALAGRQVLEVGSDDQRAAALELLASTRRRLYALLAEEPAATSGEPTAPTAPSGEASTGDV
jgi:DNA-binding PadR family transcriptional regulator